MKYDSINYRPPAPVITVRVYRPYSDSFKEGLGKIDTGADITVIPDKWVEELSLRPAEIVSVKTFDGRTITKTVYFINLEFHKFNFELVKAISLAGKDVLIGRNVLNNVKLILDGKNLDLQILDP